MSNPDRREVARVPGPGVVGAAGEPTLGGFMTAVARTTCRPVG